MGCTTLDAQELSETDVPIYAYYEGCIKEDEFVRIKQQIKGTEGALTSSIVIPGPFGSIDSYAGYNDNTPGLGTIYWLRSPEKDPTRQNRAWSCVWSGLVDYSNYASGKAYPVAPAFCI